MAIFVWFKLRTTSTPPTGSQPSTVGLSYWPKLFIFQLEHPVIMLLSFSVLWETGVGKALPLCARDGCGRGTSVLLCLLLYAGGGYGREKALLLCAGGGCGRGKSILLCFLLYAGGGYGREKALLLCAGGGWGRESLLLCVGGGCGSGKSVLLCFLLCAGGGCGRGSRSFSLLEEAVVGGSHSISLLEEVVVVGSPLFYMLNGVCVDVETYSSLC